MNAISFNEKAALAEVAYADLGEGYNYSKARAALICERCKGCFLDNKDKEFVQN